MQTYSSTASSSAATPSTERQILMEKSAAIFEDKADEGLTSKDKIVYNYREERTKQWVSSSGTTNLSEQEFNKQ
jgi:hypothetical protein